jgi:hypothetical protein
VKRERLFGILLCLAGKTKLIYRKKYFTYLITSLVAVDGFLFSYILYKLKGMKDDIYQS